LAARSLRTPLGRLSLRGERADECERAVEIALERAARRAPIGEFVDVLGKRAYFKGEPLRGWARVRWTAKSWFFARPMPRVRELRNLEWLRERLFLAPRPVCAGVLSRGGAPWYQFLLTEAVDGAETLAHFLADEQSDGVLRAQVLDELADEVARMHSIHFVHHDLFLRNVLVVRGAPHSRVYFLDAWAGGPTPQLRGPAYDLACLTLDSVLSDRDVEAFFDRYCAERENQERPVDRRALVSRVQRERASLQRPE
jgi:hypothetical protein